MNFPEIIDLSSDEEAVEIPDVKPDMHCNSVDDLATKTVEINKFYKGSVAALGNKKGEERDNLSALRGLPDGPNVDVFRGGQVSKVPSFCRKFWKAGDYEVEERFQPFSQGSQVGKNHLRVHPKFLHSNATSHKWVFGAIAELVDNTVDEIQKGATFANIDKVSVPVGGPALLVQDDGGGMDPESLRSCISFGFSNKSSGSSIGQYGNGFKTSTMRLGADVIVFSRSPNGRTSTQSVGLLSYTFLRETGSDDIVVPIVDYVFDSIDGEPRRLMVHGEKYFSSNLLAICKWSPFSTEADLLKQFREIGQHGTRILVYNLWYSSDDVLELDFDFSESDIIASGTCRSPEKPTKHNKPNVTEEHIGLRLRYSLRAYLSVLYLHVPSHFRIILRGEVVQPHSLLSDLRYVECIKYTPNFEGNKEEVITTIGFLEGSPKNVDGFNVYHRNRLILPFLRVVNHTGSNGRGVSGVLEANFINPTHDKQDFEKSTLYFRLENRLKDMQLEYWKYHCHLVGYQGSVSKHAVPRNAATSLTNTNCTRPNGTPQYQQVVIPMLRSETKNSQTGIHGKRQRQDIMTSDASFKRQTLGGEISTIRNGQDTNQQEDIAIMLQENKNLLLECGECEKTEKELTAKVDRLKKELADAHLVLEKLNLEFKLLNLPKIEQP